jgi:DNA-binding LacI/PurR family transcriptional regulator
MVDFGRSCNLTSGFYFECSESIFLNRFRKRNIKSMPVKRSTKQSRPTIRLESGRQGLNLDSGRLETGLNGKRATLKDLAKALNVAPSTISNAYNRPDQLSKSLRSQILEMAQQMGYSGPHPVARGLRQQHLGVIGVLFGARLSYAFRDPAAVMFLQGISEATEKEGFGLTIVPAPLGELHDHLGVRNAAVDGFITYGLTKGLLIQSVLKRRLPLVLVDHTRDSDTLSDQALHVNIDDEGGARRAARHLLKLGHRRIGILCLERSDPPRSGWVIDSSATVPEICEATRARLAGYTSELEAAGLVWSHNLFVFECRSNTHGQGRLGLREMLALPNPPTAILAMSDVLALGVLEEARSLGLKIPEDIGVIGFDDVPEAARADLSSVNQPHLEKGRAAAELLLARFRGETVVSPARLETNLVIRATS